MTALIKPPFTLKKAIMLIIHIEAAWNKHDDDYIMALQTIDSLWQCNEKNFIGIDAIRHFLSEKRKKELHNRLLMTLHSHTTNKLSVIYESEWQHAKTGQWYRTQGQELLTYSDQGLIKRRYWKDTNTAISSDQRHISLKR